MQGLSAQMEFISSLGSNIYIIGGLLILVVVFLLRQRHFKTSIVVVLSAVSLFYSNFLKYLFKHQRPLEASTEYYMPFDIYAFPSTHVLFYTTFWGFIFYLTYKYDKEAKLLLHMIRWVAAYMIVSIGSSRVYLGVHHLKDIVGGYIFGLFFLLLLIWLDKRLEETIIKNK